MNTDSCSRPARPVRLARRWSLPGLAVAAWLLLCLAPSAQAEVSHQIECRRFSLLGDFPLGLQADFRIRVFHEPADAFYHFETSLWRVGDFASLRAELELSFEGIGTLTEHATNVTLRQMDGTVGFGDEFSFQAVSQGEINVEDHVVVDFGVQFLSSDPGMVSDHLADPAVAKPGLANSAACTVRIRRLDRAPNFPLSQMTGTVQSIALVQGPDQALDPDGDQLANAVDNCPRNYNPGQHNADHDRVGDACDRSFSRDILVIQVPAGDGNALNDAMVTASGLPVNSVVEIRLAGNIDLMPPVQIGTPPPNFDTRQVLLVERDVRLVGARSDGQHVRLRNAGAVNGLRMARVAPGGRLRLENVQVSGLETEANGAVVQVDAGGDLRIVNSHFEDNRSEGDGGVVHFVTGGSLQASDSEFGTNEAARGGALFLDAPDAAPHTILLERSQLYNSAAGTGGDVHARLPASAGASTLFDGLTVGQAGPNSIFVEAGDLQIRGSSMSSALGLVSTGGELELLNSALVTNLIIQEGQACFARDGGRIVSLGHNLADDESCGLDQASDRVAFPGWEDGTIRPLPDSPLVDSGPEGLVGLPGETVPVLPCGWKDANGLGRPQDGNEDGQFECDIGAVEHLGLGVIQHAHSGAYYNPQRSGEGQYVEILDNERALVYTFSYRPDGGPAWLLAQADIVANSLVSRSMIRPTGTPFGRDFKAADIWRSDWGGMSMVFPDCAADASSPGNAVYSGSAAQGYEPLVTRAQRLTSILQPCSAAPVPPLQMAGLSGSFYDPQRSGEGLVVQWLPNGNVLAIMFTFDLEGEQFWLFGVGTPEGKRVTIDAVYPTGNAAWGGAFDPDAVGLAPWGSLTLDYQDCDHMQFSYAAQDFRFGSATRSYQRLTKLAGTVCPQF